MSSQTLTNTAWGELRVTHGEADQQLRAVCKRCGRVTEQIIASDANPFQAVRPQHERGCRFHPDSKPQMSPVSRPTGPRASHAVPAQTWSASPLSRVEAVLAAGLVLAAVITGAWLF